MQVVPRVQIYESIICRNYYAEIDTQEGDSYDTLCKVQTVQKELSLVQGIERLTELVPGEIYNYLMAATEIDFFQLCLQSRMDILPTDTEDVTF